MSSILVVVLVGLASFICGLFVVSDATRRELELHRAVRAQVDKTVGLLPPPAQDLWLRAWLQAGGIADDPPERLPGR